jgi:ABC-type sugar transport system permease subunit
MQRATAFGSSRQVGRSLAPYLFVAPFLISFAAFYAWPMLYAFGLSLTNWRGTGAPRWLGAGNYAYLLQNPDFWGALGNSSLLWLMVVPAQLLLGLVLAVALSSTRLKLKAFYRTAFIAPFITPLVAMAQVWIVLFDRDFGLVNGVLAGLGLAPVGWLTDPNWAKPTLALLVLWKTSGFVVIIFLAGLQNISRDVYEAAELDGAGPVQRFFLITMPLMRRTIAFFLVIQTMMVFQMFAEPFVVTKGGPFGSTRTVGYYLYSFITNSDLGTGAAVSMLLVVIVLVLSLVSVRLMGAREDRV